MDTIKAILYSDYYIDGAPAGASPGRMLDSECGLPSPDFSGGEPIVDESVDPDPAAGGFDESGTARYLALTSGFKGCRTANPAYAAAFTRSRIALAVIGMIWHKGDFKLEDISIRVDWKWNVDKVGGYSSFYESVEAACNYAEGLGVRMTGYSMETSSKNKISVHCSVDGQPEEEDDEDELDDSAPAGKVYLQKGRKCQSTLGADSSDWLIYIPFDSCDFHLGNSLLSELTGKPAGREAEIEDPDYFMDCFEVVRELVEDGVVIAGSTVCDGGMITALSAMTSGGNGATVDLGGISEAYKTDDSIALLFAEVPGVIIEIRDQDFDYIDAEFVLQDVAYYPIGHPVPGKTEILVSKGKGGISGIIQSLIDDGTREGED
jgi:phosphoribosylformylglycinamidine synthase